MQNGSLLAPNRDPSADALKVFDGNSASSAFSVGNDLLGDDVIGVGCEAVLAPTEFLEFAPAAPGSFGLQLAAESTVPMPNILDAGAGVIAAVRIRGYVRNPHVEAEPVIHFFWSRFNNVAGNGQVPLAPMVEQVGFTLPRGQQSLLARPGNVGDSLPALQRPDAHSAFLEAQNAVIVGNRTSLRELPLAFLVRLVGIGNFGEHADGELSTETERLAGFVIEGLLKREVLKHLSLPRLFTQPVGAFVGAMKCSQQGATLFGGRKQFDLGRDLQYLSVSQAKETL